MEGKKQLTKEQALSIVQDNIKKIEGKEFNIYFFVPDTKGVPSGSLEYIYQTAQTLAKLGYKVTILHNEEEFIGVSEWFGTDFAQLPHKNIEKENVEISPCDFLFIPKLFSDVATQTKSLPCKRVFILQNYNFLMETMPYGVTPFDLGINEVIATTKVQEEKIKGFFPMIRTHVVSPAIQKVFRKPTEPKKLIVNLICKNQSDVNRIIKPFYWKYPLYKWVTFRDLRTMPQETYAEALREGILTIWADDKTNFGYSALEALRCGSIVLAKIPETPTDWMIEEDENGETTLPLSFSWFSHIDDIPDMIASIVRSWTLDAINFDVEGECSKFDSKFTIEQQEEEIKTVYETEIFGKRLKEFKEVLRDVENNKIKIG